MGYDYDFDEPVGRTMDMSDCLDAASDARRELIKERHTKDIRSTSRLSCGEDNDSQIYESNEDYSLNQLPPRESDTIQKRSAGDDDSGYDPETDTITPSITNEDARKLEEEINKLEKDFGTTLNPAQKKYIKGFKHDMTCRFDTYTDFVSYINNYSEKYGRIEPEEYLLYHLVFTMENPEFYVDLLSKDVFNSHVEYGGMFPIVDSFRKTLREE